MRLFEMLSSRWRASPHKRRGVLLGLAAVFVVLVGVRVLSVRKVESQSGAGRNGGGAARNPSVDVVLARAGLLREELEYTGTTRPTREISLRSRSEGRLISLNVDVGDPVHRGQELGRVDDTLQRTTLRQVEAELASRQSEAAAARNDVADARTQVEQARADLYQKEADFKRVYRLWGEGYEAKQTAERAQTAARMARQVLKSTQAQVSSALSAVRAAEGRVAAQKAAVAQERERLSYSVLRSPIDGAVTARFVQAGDLVQNGADVVRVGDFRLTQVDVQVSELELKHVAVGQLARVRLDARGGVELRGRVDRISPQADPVSRLVPVTVTLSNEAGLVGAGMLARVRFGAVGVDGVLIPEAALQLGGRRGGEGAGAGGAPNGAPPLADRGSDVEGVQTASAFVLVGEGRPAGAADNAASEAAPTDFTRRLYRVESRPIRIGARGDGQVEVLEGLAAGDRVVSRSTAPLKDGMEVQPSILSAEAFQPARPARGAASGADPVPGAAPSAPQSIPPGNHRGTGAPSAGAPGGPGAGTRPDAGGAPPVSGGVRGGSRGGGSNRSSGSGSSSITPAPQPGVGGAINSSGQSGAAGISSGVRGQSRTGGASGQSGVGSVSGIGTVRPSAPFGTGGPTGSSFSSGAGSGFTGRRSGTFGGRSTAPGMGRGAGGGPGFTGSRSTAPDSTGTGIGGAR